MLKPFMLKPLAASVLGLVAMLVTLAPALAEKRVALVVGNAAYEHVPKLVNPSNDATDIAAKLRGLGFDVVEGIDLGKRDMEKRIRAFATSLAGADVGLFYYAGHGLQVDQKNYLAPVDAELKSESDLDFEAVELDLVLKQMLRNAGTSIVFLDACRDNPLAQNLKLASRSIEIGRGLARVDAAASMMVVYSAEFGKVALDGSGRNSPFTEALLRHIDTEGESIGDMMIEVRNDVLRSTNGQQRPFESASLTGQFFFKPAPQQAASTTNTDAEIASLRVEIARLQSDQGALLKSQQEQLQALQEKLADETKSAPAAATSPSPAAAATTPPAADVAKVAAAEGTSPSEPVPAAPPTTSPDVPPRATRDQLAADMLGELKRLGCYSGSLSEGWTASGEAALDRFNRLATLELPVDEPQQASLETLKGWNGPHCPIEKVVAPRLKPPRQSLPSAAAPRKAGRKQLRSAPPLPPAQASHPRPAPPSHSAGGGDEQRELQRAFPSAAWPGQ